MALHPDIESMNEPMGNSMSDFMSDFVDEPMEAVGTSLVETPVVAEAHRALGARRRPLGRATHVVTRVLIGIVILVLSGMAIVVVGPRFLPYQALIVRSGSMSPTIPTGSVAFYHKEPATQVHVGQVILFNEPGKPTIRITHRVVKIVDSTSGRYFVTKGDANAQADDWRVPAVGTGWVVDYHVPYLGYALADLGSRWARWVLVSVPAFALAVILLYELLRADASRRRNEPEAA